MISDKLPKLITFDGEARSGKGTIVQATKDYLQEVGHKTMLIDAGQVFRVLVVAAGRSGVDVDSAEAIDAFFDSEEQSEKAAQLVKEVYHMPKEQRNALLYTNEVGANSAKIGARPGSQAFKDRLLEKWLHDAGQEGYQIVLLDGRSLEGVGKTLESKNLCDFILGLYFICDPVVGARRTLGFATTAYNDLNVGDKQSVDELVQQIIARNRADRERTVQPIVPPADVEPYLLPDTPDLTSATGRPMVIFDTSADLSKPDMAMPVARMTASLLQSL